MALPSLKPSPMAQPLGLVMVRICLTLIRLEHQLHGFWTILTYLPSRIVGAAPWYAGHRPPSTPIVPSCREYIPFCSLPTLYAPFTTSLLDGSPSFVTTFELSNWPLLLLPPSVRALLTWTSFALSALYAVPFLSAFASPTSPATKMPLHTGNHSHWRHNSMSGVTLGPRSTFLNVSNSVRVALPAISIAKALALLWAAPKSFRISAARLWTMQQDSISGHTTVTNTPFRLPPLIRSIGMQSAPPLPTCPTAVTGCGWLNLLATSPVLPFVCINGSFGHPPYARAADFAPKLRCTFLSVLPHLSLSPDSRVPRSWTNGCWLWIPIRT